MDANGPDNEYLVGIGTRFPSEAARLVPVEVLLECVSKAQ